MTSSVGSDERQPLLHPSADLLSHSDSSNRPRFWPWFTGAATSLKEVLFGNPVLICTFGLQFCTYFAKHMVEVPMIKLFEQAICNRYYDTHGNLSTPALGSINEHLCKIPPIQNELAGLVGLKFTFDALPGQWPLVTLSKARFAQGSFVDSQRFSPLYTTVPLQTSKASTSQSTNAY